MKIHLTPGALRIRAAAVLAAGGLALSTAAIPALQASAAPPPKDPPPADPCPAAYPVSELTAGQDVTGLTVSTGTTPDGFTGEVLGVIDDGVMPGLDMIMVRLTSDEIDRVGGIWQGMSGSPVYASDGRLIGAVAYGLAWGPSPVAGVTPAEDMQALLGDAAPVSPRLAGKVALPKTTAKQLVASGAATERQVDEGLSQLKVPVGVSGAISNARLKQVNKLLGMKGIRLFRAAGTTASAEPTAMIPGGNLAASLAYGDFSAVGVGTTTMVCDDQLVGFGHPFRWTGATSMTLHGADAIYVQEDPVSAPFKVANPSGPVGIIDNDRRAGIAGIIGALPETATITTNVTSGDTSRTGTTVVSIPEWSADAAAIGLLANQDRVLDRIGGGSALVHFTISGETADGTPFSIERTNRQTSEWDISYQTIFELGSYVYEIFANRYTDVTFTDIDVDVTFSDEAKMFRIGKVEVLQDGEWKIAKRGSTIRAKAGKTLKLRTTLTSYRDRFGTQVVEHTLLVPAKAAGRRGYLDVTGGGGYYGYYEGEVDYPDASEEKTFDTLLADLESQPRNDQVSAILDFSRMKQLPGMAQLVTTPDVVEGGRYFQVRVN